MTRGRGSRLKFVLYASAIYKDQFGLLLRFNQVACLPFG